MSTIRNLIIVTAIAVLTGCSSGSTATGVGVANMAGTWLFTLWPSMGRPTIELTGRIVDTDGTLSGTVAATRNPAFSQCFQGGAIAGSVDGNQLVLSFTDDDLASVINLSGTVSGSAASGNWSLGSGPAECLNLAGAWSANRTSG